ncbi:hypothetical protein GCK32_020052, partial [Trichostrongylus colubriformis]
MQAAGQIIDANQYYYATAPPQPMAPQPGVSYQYPGGFYAEPYVVASTPSQGAQQVMMPVDWLILDQLKIYSISN